MRRARSSSRKASVPGSPIRNRECVDSLARCVSTGTRRDQNSSAVGEPQPLLRERALVDVPPRAEPLLDPGLLVRDPADPDVRVVLPDRQRPAGTQHAQRLGHGVGRVGPVPGLRVSQQVQAAAWPAAAGCRRRGRAAYGGCSAGTPGPCPRPAPPRPPGPRGPPAGRWRYPFPPRRRRPVLRPAESRPSPPACRRARAGTRGGGRRSVRPRS